MTDQGKHERLAPALRPEFQPELGPEQGEPQLPVLRFSLRSLFVSLTLVCVVLAVVVSGAGSGVASLAVVLAVLVVVLHLAGAAIGTRLREHADQHREWRSAQSGMGVSPELPAMSRSPLHRRGLPMPWLPAWVAVGAVAGGLAGAALLAITVGDRATTVGVVVGAISTAVLGGWFAFLAVSFWAIFRHGWRDAVSEDFQTESRDETER